MTEQQAAVLQPAAAPDQAEELYRSGCAQLRLARAEEALARFDAALALKPGHLDAVYCRGNALMLLHRYANAGADYDTVIARAPGHIGALYYSAAALMALELYEEALGRFGRVIALRPDHVDALDGRGVALAHVGRADEALASFDKALALKHDGAGIWSNRGQALMSLQRPEDALACFDKAHALKPDLAEALHNRAVALAEMNRVGEAIASYDEAIVIMPGHAEAHFGRSLCRLLQGDYARGWREFEWRWETEQLRSARRDFPQPSWRGEDDVANRTVLLNAEQGLGDTIQFCRFAKLVELQGAKVVLEVQRELRAFIASSFGPSIRVIASGETIPPFDRHCPLMSLPLALKLMLDALPMETRYLSAPPEKTAAWRERLGPRTKPRIGLAWAGNPRKQVLHLNRVDRQRSIELEQLAPLLGLERFAFYSLQKGDDAVARLRSSDQAARVIDLTAALADFGDTAALIENLDLVITVDTAVAHVAGALGKSFWLMNRFNTCWRWLLGRDDSPWYPTARIFRQPSRGDWASVVDNIASALQSWRPA